MSVPTKAQLIVAFFFWEDAAQGIVEQDSEALHCFSFPVQSTGMLLQFYYNNTILLVFQHCSLSWVEILQRELHSRNKKAMEFIAKGWNALKEVDRVIDYCELNDRRLIPLLNVINAFSTYCCLVLYLRFEFDT